MSDVPCDRHHLPGSYQAGHRRDHPRDLFYRLDVFHIAVIVGPTLTDAEHIQILAVLEQTGWHIRCPAGVAKRVGLRPTTLESRIKKLGLQRSR